MNPTLLFLLFTGIAFLLFVAEVFIPGGILGIIGAVCLLIACGFSIAAFGVNIGSLVGLFLILLTLGGFLIWLIKMPDSRIGKSFSMQTTSTHEVEDTVPDSRIGSKGTAATDLRPSGFARIDGKKTDVVAARGYIDEGSEIVVTEVHGSRVVVQPAEGDSV